MQCKSYDMYAKQTRHIFVFCVECNIKFNLFAMFSRSEFSETLDILKLRGDPDGEV